MAAFAPANFVVFVFAIVTRDDPPTCVLRPHTKNTPGNSFGVSIGDVLAGCKSPGPLPPFAMGELQEDMMSSWTTAIT